MQNDLIQKQIEALLFYIAEPTDISFLAKILGTSKEEILSAINELEKKLKERGVRVVINNDEVVVTTAPEYSEIIEKMIKEERERDLGRAGIETLTIVAYKGPITKKEIEYIRGVNCQYALRNLLLRGLIERKNNQTDMRSVSYNITIDALRYLGLDSVSELPEYEQTKNQMEAVEDDEDQSGDS